jgi:phage-related protein
MRKIAYNQAVSKRLFWLASTQDDLTAASEPVRRTMGGALRAAQDGTSSDAATPMKGNLSEVMEVREDDESGTYRLMYTVKIGDDVYVLDFFQKKSVKGIATPQADLNRIAGRLKAARRHAESVTRSKNEHP